MIIDNGEIGFKNSNLIALYFGSVFRPDIMRLAAIGCYIQGELLGSDCFGWKRQNFR